VRLLSALLFLLLPQVFAFAQTDKLYTTSDGLSNAVIYDMVQDKKGVMWLATDRGVNRFDGYDFEVFLNDPLDTNSLQSNKIESIYCDVKNNVWVGLSDGLYKYDRKKNKFEAYPLYFEGKLVNPKIRSFVEDKKNILWMASNLGLIALNQENLQVTFYNRPAAKIQDFKSDPLNVLALDQEGKLWIGSDGYGMKVFNPENNETMAFKNSRSGSNSILDNVVLSILADSKGNIIVGTLEKGILVRPKGSDTFLPVSLAEGNKASGAIYAITEDHNGKIWVGTRSGVKILDLKTLKLFDGNQYINVAGVSDSRTITYLGNDGNLWFAIGRKGLYLKKGVTRTFHTFTTENGLSNGMVKSVYFDRQKNLWVGTDGGGLNQVIDRKVLVYKHNSKDKTSISDNAIISLFQDNENSIWVGSYRGGLSEFDSRKRAFVNYLNDSINEGANLNYVTAITRKDSATLWVGTMGYGIYSFDINTKKFESFQRAMIDGNWTDLPLSVNILMVDRNENLWIGSYNGLFCWNRKRGILKEYSKKKKRLQSDNVFDLLEDKGGNIWAATGSGVYQITTDDHIISFSEAEGLASAMTLSLLEDNSNNLWIGTENGLSKLNIRSKVSINYYTEDGLPANEFANGSRFKRSDGLLYFGTASGLVYFHPDSIKGNVGSPKLIFSKLKLFNSDVLVGKPGDDTSIITAPIDEANVIRLKHSDNSFSIEFAALDFNNPEKIKYSYKMEGFDENWIIKNYKQRSATYTNLSPGTYTFKIRSTNSDGIWTNNFRSIEVRISPPWWKTWWAKLLCLCIILSILFFVRKTMLIRWKMKNELLLERIEREKSEEITQSKLRFFANISHEFKTPLTLILAPVEKLMAEENSVQRSKNLTLIYDNVLRMLRMFNQLLELQKVEEGKMELSLTPVNLTEFIRNLAEPFKELSHQKNIEFEVDLPPEPLVSLLDQDKIEKVIFNLLMNAYKFTPAGGKIRVILKKRAVKKEETTIKWFQITVSDTGVGIPKDHFEKIFQRFYQVENAKGKYSSGTGGIGLHLVKTFIDLHKGEIEVYSEEGTGSSFIVKIPAQVEKTSGLIHKKSRQELPEYPSVHDIPKVKNSYRILIVEDDLQILEFLKSELANEYVVLEATNGKEGLDIAQKEIPDLIISDIMMPEMDGTELCRMVKQDINTCHIPVILLTARSSVEERVEGLETGADSYIPKPFHLNHLKTRIGKLIELRENLKKKFSKSLIFEPKELTLMSVDEKFLAKAIQFVKENISDSELNIEGMGKQLAMSRGQFYKKIKALTDQSPSEFVRTIRLKQAAYMLRQDKYNISEVAYEVGFSSHQYFTNCFKEYFNMSPTEYLQRNSVKKVKAMNG
jgi:signal transduction histidine kinase/ligand-binding sensor domain-containing protein/DNA-binding response OmpR family regulator